PEGTTSPPTYAGSGRQVGGLPHSHGGRRADTLSSVPLTLEAGCPHPSPAVSAAAPSSSPALLTASDGPRPNGSGPKAPGWSWLMSITRALRTWPPPSATTRRSRCTVTSHPPPR